MKANELRIGNLVKIGGEISQLELCDFVDIYEHKTIWQYEPIELTEEWLLRFGFVANNYNYEFELHPLTLDCEYTDKGEWITLYENTVLQSEIKYVHQLQNLYFALTGEELTLSE